MLLFLGIRIDRSGDAVGEISSALSGDNEVCSGAPSVGQYGVRSMMGRLVSVHGDGRVEDEVTGELTMLAITTCSHRFREYCGSDEARVPLRRKKAVELG